MPLCPTCVVEHTEEHYECNQKPAYVNLHDALQDSKQKCYANIVKLEEFNRKNVIISPFRVNFPTISKDSPIIFENNSLSAKKSYTVLLTKSLRPLRAGLSIKLEANMQRMESIVVSSAKMSDSSSWPKLKPFIKKSPNSKVTNAWQPSFATTSQTRKALSTRWDK